MRILIVHRHFWPDTAPQGTILRAIGEHWAGEGHEVSVFTAQPSYGDGSRDEQLPSRERLGGLAVRRAPLLRESKQNYFARAANYGLFFLQAFAHVVFRRRRFDVVLGMTAPPIIPGLVLGVASRLRGSRYVYNAVDIYPEIAKSVGLMTDGRRFAFLKAVDSWSVRKADHVVVISQDMANVMEARGVERSRISVIRELDLEQFETSGELPPALAPREGVFRVLFAGNLGRFQGLPAIVEAATLLGEDSGIQFDFLGDGVMENELREQAGPLLGNTVHFHGRVSPVDARLAAEAADVCLVTLNPEIIRYAYPAKIVGYLKAATQVVAMVDQDSSLATLVRDRQLGLVVPPGDAPGLADALRSMQQSPDASASDRARRAFDELYDTPALLARWSEIPAGQ